MGFYGAIGLLVTLTSGMQTTYVRRTLDEAARALSQPARLM